MFFLTADYFASMDFLYIAALAGLLALTLGLLAGCAALERKK
ncbi:MAG TPA: hypothetical protein VN815_01555 [Steroidobacteraceae bacterium]|nr:hypothetical protein [Steroidobacteraceae bacterium]